MNCSRIDDLFPCFLRPILIQGSEDEVELSEGDLLP
jgi:hypothetical protein